MWLLSSLSLFKSLLIIFEKERENEKAGKGGGGREREHLKQGFTVNMEPNEGAQSHEPLDHDLSRNQELDA